MALASIGRSNSRGYTLKKSVDTPGIICNKSIYLSDIDLSDGLGGANGDTTPAAETHDRVDDGDAVYECNGTHGTYMNAFGTSDALFSLDFGFDLVITH